MDISKRRINPQNPARTIRGRKMRKSAILAAAAKSAALVPSAISGSVQPIVATAPTIAQAATPTREGQPEQA